MAMIQAARQSEENLAREQEQARLETNNSGQ